MDLNEIKAKWPTLTLLEKLLAILSIPVVLFLLVLKFWGDWNTHQDNALDKTTADHEKDLQKQEQKTDAAIAQDQGAIDQLKKDEAKAVTAAASEDADDFYNNRNYPRDDK